jgi:hypothetical protein
VSPFRRTVVPVVLLTALAAACTGGGDDEPSAQPTSASCAPGECVVSTDPGDIAYQPGEYEYTFNGVTANFSLDSGTLEVKNDSPAEIGKPGMYVISGDDQRYEASVEAPAVIPQGESATFTVTFPDQVDDTSVGLMVLLFGGSNFGAMHPVPVA